MSPGPVLAEPAPRRRALLAVTLVALAGAVAVLVDRVRSAELPVPLDYYQYWSAGWLLAHNENPYDPSRMHEVQAAAGMPAGFAVLSWHPPWTLAVTLPFGQLPPATGWLLWTLVQLAAVCAAANLLWWGCGGPPRRQWVACGLAAMWAPTAMLIGAGQVTGLCLLGVVGFAAAMRAGRPGLAGATAALTAIKPHLLALFGLILVLDALKNRASRKAVLAGGATLAAAVLLVVAVRPTVLGEYLDTLTNRHGTNPYRVQDTPSPTLGWFLRDAVAPDSFAVSLVPLAVLATAAVAVWWVRRVAWDWPRAVPWLVLGSMLAPSYGAFAYDLVLLLAPVLAVAARLAVPGTSSVARWLGAGWFAAVSGGLFVCLRFGDRMAITDYVFVTPAVLLAVLVTGRVAGWWGRGPAVPATVPVPRRSPAGVGP